MWQWSVTTRSPGRLYYASLIRVSQPAYELGYESARLLLSRLNGYSGSTGTLLLPTLLEVGDASGASDQATAVREHDPRPGASNLEPSLEPSCSRDFTT